MLSSVFSSIFQALQSISAGRASAPRMCSAPGSFSLPSRQRHVVGSVPGVQGPNIIQMKPQLFLCPLLVLRNGAGTASPPYAEREGRKSKGSKDLSLKDGSSQGQSRSVLVVPSSLDSGRRKTAPRMCSASNPCIGYEVPHMSKHGTT